MVSFLGLVIGISQDNYFDYLVYSKLYDNLIRIDRTVKDVANGRWLLITVKDSLFNGEYVLTEYNSTGYENYNLPIPPSKVSVRYFPLKENSEFGEIILCLKVNITKNNADNKMFIENGYVNSNHIKDYNNLLNNYNGTVIIELQASLKGWILLKVHENQEYCDNLAYSVAPYDVSYLDETNLASILTKNQLKYRNKRIGRSIGRSIAISITKPGPIDYDVLSGNFNTNFVLNDINEDEKLAVTGTNGLHDIGKLNTIGNIQIDDKDDEIKVICIAIKLIEGGAILHSTLIGNCLLLFQNIQEEDNCIQIGGVYYLGVKRGLKTILNGWKDEYHITHVACKLYKNDMLEEICEYKKSIRSFGNFIEVQIIVDLRIKSKVTALKYEKYYLLETVNCYKVLIERNRLSHLLDSNLTANLTIQCWASLVSQKYSIFLQIGPKTKVFCIDDEKNITQLPY